MPSFLSGIAGKAVAALALVAILVAGYLRYAQVVAQRDAAESAVTAAQSTIADLRQTNADNTAALAKLKSDYDRATAATAATVADAQRRAADLTTVQRMIRHAPPADRGTVPPVILHTIDGLLTRADPAPGAADAHRGSPTTGAASTP